MYMYIYIPVYMFTFSALIRSFQNWLVSIIVVKSECVVAPSIIEGK